MEKTHYLKPMAKVFTPKFKLLDTLPVGSDPNDEPIEGKSTRFMDDDDSHSWGRVWGRNDD